MSDKKGGYRLVSLKLIELSTMIACAGLYQAIESSHDKPLCLCDILVSGAKKNNVYITAIKGTNKYTLKNVYGYDIEVTNEDAVEVTPNVDGIELPVPTPEDDGSIVGVNVQGKYVLKPYPLPEVTGADNGKVLEVLAGAWGLGGKKVKVIAPPSSATLTDEEIAIFQEGVFINGVYMGLKNAIVFPFIAAAGYNASVMMFGSNAYGQFEAKTFILRVDTDKTLTNAKTLIQCGSTGKLGLSELVVINGKDVPAYPADTGTFTLKCVNGALTWVQDQ